MAAASGGCLRRLRVAQGSRRQPGKLPRAKSREGSPLAATLLSPWREKRSGLKRKERTEKWGSHEQLATGLQPLSPTSI